MPEPIFGLKGGNVLQFMREERMVRNATEERELH